MRKTLLYIAVLILSLPIVSCNTSKYNGITTQLEAAISKRQYYFDKQVEKINAEEQKLLEGSSKIERFNTCYKLFNLSRSYKYDIAYKYSNEALNIALEINNPDLICRAQASKISTFTSGGLFTEAAEVIKSVSTTMVSDSIKRELYYNIIRYYSDQIDYASETEFKEKYIAQLQSYTDSIIHLSTQKDYYYAYAKAYSTMSRKQYTETISVLSTFYKNTKSSHHHNSIITFLLGNAYFAVGDQNNGFKYMAKSVEHDVKAAARENRSIKTIAQLLFDKGETAIANELINVAFDDAKFYNARHRNLEINTLLPIINQHRIATISKQRNTLYVFIIIISILSIIAIVFVAIARKNALMVKKSQRIIQMQLEKLSQINTQLMEANNIKEHYIIESLYKNNEHLEQTETLLQKINLKVKSRLFDDLKNIHKDFNIKQQRELFYSDFDKAFLKLFPNFIEEYNSLFVPDDRIDTKNIVALPAEVRIFALMRLGITDNERISKFLDLSINTIYTYKTKVKNKTTLPKDEFEKRILNIRLSVGDV